MSWFGNISKSLNSENLLLATTALTPIGPLLATHQGRVLADGMEEGAIRGIGGIADGLTSIFRTITGQPISSAPTFADRMADGYRSGLKTITGSEGPTIRKGTNDEFIHGAGEIVGDTATYFIPIPCAGALKIAVASEKITSAIRLSSEFALGARKVGKYTAHGADFIAKGILPLDSFRGLVEITSSLTGFFAPHPRLA